MDEHANAARAREAIAAFRSGDMDTYREFFADDVVWHVGGDHPLSGDYRGRDALFGYFARAAEMTSGSIEIEPEAILASDRHVAMFTRVTARRDGKALDVVLAQMLKVGPDGRWTEYWALADDQEAVDRFWGDA